MFVFYVTKNIVITKTCLFIFLLFCIKSKLGDLQQSTKITKKTFIQFKFYAETKISWSISSAQWNFISSQTLVH